MISAKAGSRRTTQPRTCDSTKQFRKDWDLLMRFGRYDTARLKQVLLLLVANEVPLGPEGLDYPSKGKRVDHRECHVGGDFLLIYMIAPDRNNEIVRFVRAGTHAVLFE